MKASNIRLVYPGKISTPFDKLYVPDFLGRASFPQRDPKGSTYEAIDRQYLFYMVTGHEYSFQEKGLVETGIPFGIYPRLLLPLITTYAVYYEQREIVLSDSLSKFIRNLGYDVSGGDEGSILKLKNQLRKLLNCRMCIVNLDPEKKQVIRSKDYLNHINRIEVWENFDDEEQSSNPVKAILSESFYKRIRERSFPVDHNTVEALRSSLLALDFYFFFCSRTKRLKGRDAYISWSELENQMGSNYKRRGEFARKAKIAIKKIQRFYPQLYVEYQRGRLILKRNSKPHIKEKLNNKNV